MIQKREFPAKVYGRWTQKGDKDLWNLTGCMPDDSQRYPGAAVYRNAKGETSTCTSEGMVYGIKCGHIEPQDGKEVLAWGEEFGAQLERLGISGICTYEGKDITPSVYWFSDSAYAVLCADSEENWEGKDAAWRHSGGAWIDTETRATVNGRYIYGPGPGKYGDLLGYMCQAAQCSQPRNVAAAAAELAKANFMTIGALFHKYQPVA